MLGSEEEQIENTRTLSLEADFWLQHTCKCTHTLVEPLTNTHTYACTHIGANIHTQALSLSHTHMHALIHNNHLYTQTHYTCEHTPMHP